MQVDVCYSRELYAATLMVTLFTILACKTASPCCTKRSEAE